MGTFVDVLAAQTSQLKACRNQFVRDLATLAQQQPAGRGILVARCRMLLQVFVAPGPTSCNRSVFSKHADQRKAAGRREAVGVLTRSTRP
jgi:hypothetical protein